MIVRLSLNFTLQIFYRILQILKLNIVTNLWALVTYKISCFFLPKVCDGGFLEIGHIVENESELVNKNIALCYI